MSVHLIGIGGIGMSGLAQILLAQGKKISGSDLKESPLLAKLRGAGAEITIGHEAGLAETTDTVIFSSAVPPQNPELIHARNAGTQVLHRGEMLARLASNRKTIAVAGSHGKSTTTALAAQLLVSAKMDPMAVLGAEVEALGGNVRTGKGAYAVVEADESDGSFLWLSPEIGVITNIDEEHLDYFRNKREILESYFAFTGRIRPSGTLVGCADDPGVRQLLAAYKKRAITYGLSEGAQIRAQEIELQGASSRYRCIAGGRNLGILRLQIPGLHNVVNSLAVVAVSQLLQIDPRVTKAALEEYRGAKRRFQIQGEVDGVLVVEDYAHHPSEIQATLQAAKGFSRRRIRCVFQPHRYSRTRYLMDRWATCFSLADEVILLPIYAASEEPIDGVASEKILRAVAQEKNGSAHLKDAVSTLQYLERTSESGDCILFLGAGDVGELACRLVERLNAGKCYSLR